jgi:hypothetical protein
MGEENGDVRLSIDPICRADFYKSDKGADKTSRAISIIGIGAVP